MRRIVLGMDPISILNLSKIPGIPTKERVEKALELAQSNDGKQGKSGQRSYADVMKTAKARVSRMAHSRTFKLCFTS